jgi:hypothetical protein
LFPFIQPKGWETFGILDHHPFQKGSLWQLGPKWDFREVFKDEPKNFFLVLMGEGSDSCSDERVLKFHSLS